jgi:hypothetical protein
VTFAPTFGVFVTNYFEVGLELSVGYSARPNESSSPSSTPPDSTTTTFAITPVARVHIPASDHIFFSIGLLLGYGRAVSEEPWRYTGVGWTTSKITADGFVVAGEVGLEIAVEHIVIPIWLRPIYRPWTLETEIPETSTPDADLSDVVLAFGTGIMAYF